MNIHLLRLLAMTSLLLTSSAHAWDYRYSDGSANVYQITALELHYVPVKKEASSSGVYSGGAEKRVALNAAELKTLVDLLNAATLDTAVHTDKRVMMSGAVSSDVNGVKTTVILTPQAPIKRKIEAQLADLLKFSR